MNLNYLFFPNFNPIILSIGPVSFYWYGFMYFISFIFAIYILLKRRINLNFTKDLYTRNEIETLIYFCFIGIFVGGRIGYVLFYNLFFYIDNISHVFRIWDGGMSFHGGLIGVVIAIKLFSYRFKKTFFQISDFVVPVIPFGLGLGRIGNFINGELWGRVCINLPWAMLFPGSQEQDIIFISTHPYVGSLFDCYGVLPRHPSQLYEMLLEGLILFLILNWFVLKPRPVGSVSGLFLLLYGLFRFFLEFFREPDVHLGFIFRIFSMGQLLSLPMIFFGVLFLYVSYYKYK